MHRIGIHILAPGCLLLVAVLSAYGADKNQPIEKPVKQSIDIRQATQKKEEQWRLDKEQLLGRLESLQQEQAALEARKADLDHQVDAAQGRVAVKEKQLADIEQISSQILPFLDEMIGELERQLSEGLPYLVNERRNRMSRLKSLMAEPDVSISEKYRKVMEALLVEAEYGFTIEVYQETIALENQNTLVDIFRLGRLNLFYLSLDRNHCGFYNVATSSWQPLSKTHIRDIRSAVDIAAKRRPAEMLDLPLGRIATQ